MSVALSSRLPIDPKACRIGACCLGRQLIRGGQGLLDRISGARSLTCAGLVRGRFALVSVWLLLRP